MPHERAEVSVLEVLRQQLAGELVRLVNRELRAPLGPRHDVVASRVVHHVVPASERGWESVSGAPSRDENRAVTRRADTICIQRSATRARTLSAGRAAPPRPSWTPSRPGVRLSPSRPPLDRLRASRGALCARTGVERETRKTIRSAGTIRQPHFHSLFQKKCRRRWRRKTRPRGPRDPDSGFFRIPLQRRAMRSADNRPARRFGAAHRTRERAPRAPPDPRLRASILAASRDTPRETRCASP